MKKTLCRPPISSVPVWSFSSHPPRICLGGKFWMQTTEMWFWVQFCSFFGFWCSLWGLRLSTRDTTHNPAEYWSIEGRVANIKDWCYCAQYCNGDVGEVRFFPGWVFLYQDRLFFNLKTNHQRQISSSTVVRIPPAQTTHIFLHRYWNSKKHNHG